MRVHWLQHAPFEGLGSIGAWLQDRGARVSASRHYDGEKLPGVEGLDLVIAMGGPMSVNDDAQLPWLAAERQFTPALVQALVAHCPEDLAPGAFVRSEEELRTVTTGA